LNDVASQSEPISTTNAQVTIREEKVFVIKDRSGIQYQVNGCGSGDFKRFNIEYLGKRVGFVNYHFEGDEVLHLDDIHIEKMLIQPPWFFVNLVFWTFSFPPKKWRTTNFRNRGIGTAMVQLLADYARSKSAKRIEGEIKPHDFKDNTDLPSWYQRRGFTVVMGDEKTAWEAKISLAV
jgi:hypothetical protein